MEAMTGKEYQRLAMRTNDGGCTYRLLQVCAAPCKIGDIINASLGLSGEVGELNDMIKKAVFHEHPIDRMKVEKEIGDIMWYVALMCEGFGFDMAEVMALNIAKLKARYPDGFDTERSLHRQEGDV